MPGTLPSGLKGSVSPCKDNVGINQPGITAGGQIFHVAFPESCPELTDRGTQKAVPNTQLTEFQFCLLLCIRPSVTSNLLLIYRGSNCQGSTQSAASKGQR